MNGINKAFNIIKNTKIYHFLRKVKHKLIYYIKQIKFILHKKASSKLINSINFKKFSKIIIFENSFGWNNLMKQRPQQIAENFDEDILFIYGSPYEEYDSPARIKKLKNNLYLIDLSLYRNIILKKLQNFKNKYLMIYSTDYIELNIIKKYDSFEIIYEYVDDIDENLCGKETAKLLLDRHHYILENLNPYVVATATKLYNNAKEHMKTDKISLITNGTDYEYFSKNPRAVPADMKKYISKDNIIIGYYGALASWVDYDLIKQVAKSNPKYQIILVGLDYDKTLGSSNILNLKNVHFLGKKSYSELTKYLYNFDICMLPFKINDITLSTSPVKIFEYMSAQKPIVSTALPECKKYDSILWATNTQDFITNINLAYNKKNNKDYLNILKKEALKNTWSIKCKQIIELIGGTNENSNTIKN